ncbi:GNAT family N-acetyltransferase [Streptomyces sp. NPDC048629]|uniref:GNAT family N-acetyltransferase n=1 Tax=Streptomyces sp. NPDC048629 TaxID=3154824 RepID=UPI003429AF56
MATQVTFRQADERDLDLLVGLYEGAARWMARSGSVQWRPGGRGAEYFRGRISEREVWLAYAAEGGPLVGSYELWWDDEPAWGPQPPVAGYVHGLMIDRDTAPAGTGATLLADAEARITAGGRGLARLDCLARVERLRSYYEKAGYRVVGENTGKPQPDGSHNRFTLMEKSL